MYVKLGGVNVLSVVAFLNSIYAVSTVVSLASPLVILTSFPLNVKLIALPFMPLSKPMNSKSSVTDISSFSLSINM